ncbi:MAG: hypothetical protein E7415_02675 [Ruminococcaceae bacterium]|nr:hypothetical protein [Oscillospiraceae bacterium]
MDYNIIKENILNNNKKTKFIIFLIIGAILFLAFGNFGKGEADKNGNHENIFDFEKYKNELSREAEEALSQIKGAGTVEVVLSFESRGKTVIARNSQSKVQTDTGSVESRETKENSDSVVVYGQGQNETPYVTEEKLPVPSGVLVIASGADDESVRLELYEAVRALYGISSHRIKVTNFKNENN